MNQITGTRYFSSNRVSELRNQVIMKNSVLLFTLLLLAVSCKSDRKEYQLDKVFPAHLELSGTSSLSAKNEKSDVELQGMSVKYDMEGSLTSKLKVDLKTGWTVEAKIKQDIQGTAHIKPNDIFPSGAAIPIKIKMEAIISGL